MIKLIDYDPTNLTETEITIIEKIKQDPVFFTSKTISELANAYYVSESTITRTAKHLGFDSIKKLQMHIYERLSYIQRNYLLNESMNLNDIVNNMRAYYSYSVHETTDKLKLEVLEQLINDIILKKRIYTFGIGGSYFAANSLATNLNIIGYSCFATDNIHTILVMMSNFSKDDIIIIFSKSGVTKEVVTILQLANHLGIDVALITNINAKENKYNVKHLIRFELHDHEKERFPSISSKIVEILISDIIFQALLKIKPVLEGKINAANKLTEKWNGQKSHKTKKEND